MQFFIDDKGEEGWDGEFAAALARINGLVVDSGARLEGNLFYRHQAVITRNDPPDPGRKHKRRNFFWAARYKGRLLEIGFGAGHSALLALSANPALRYTGIDIFKNAYVPACAAALREMFGARVEIIKGDSRNVLPELPPGTFDLFHVDGSLDPFVCRSDIGDCIALAREQGSHLIVDDTAHPPVFAAYAEFVAAGHLITETLGGRWDARESLFAHVVRRYL